MIEKVSAFDTRFPLCAVMEAPPACAIKFAGTVAVIWFAFETVVASVRPFHRTTVPEVNPVPLTVSRKAGPPGAVDDGERLVSVSVEVIVNPSAGGEV